jgi:endonuclease/exonuclease/phosphatase family metal-dependent hydrolase
LIRVVSWNVLADAYIRHEYYPHTAPDVLNRAKRRAAVAERLASFAEVEVLCLQEVDSAVFALAEEKLPDSTGRLFRKRGRGEGCAIFVRHAVTTDPEWRELVFTDLSGHIALGVTFAGVTVVSTHLKWEPDGTPVETHRGRVQLAEILDHWSGGTRIVCGDFNVEPDSEILTFAKSRGFSDAYASLPDACTCNSNGKRKRIDFILHTSEFKATPTPLAPITNETPLPSETQPSDHIPIEARLDRV